VPLPNLAGRSLLVINGTDDPLYPAEKQRRLIDFVRQMGAEITFDVVEGGAHNVRFWPEKAEEIDTFIRSHRRDPLPDHVFWATDRTSCFNRAFWVVVDELTPPDSNDHLELALLGDRPERLGGVEVRRQGNRIDVTSHGVKRYRLLLSPEEVDLDAEVVVTTNGSESFRGVVPPSLTTLLDWAGRDMDRTMLFAAELAIEVPQAPAASGH
jgi:hypothetical protein